MKKIFSGLMMLAALAACHGKEISLDSWLGQWNGPEGTYLKLEKAADGYDVKIRDLNGEKTFSGMPEGNGIHFSRNGKTQTITAGAGGDTGMKWLSEKKDCLIVQAGEGYCRD